MQEKNGKECVKCSAACDRDYVIKHQGIGPKYQTRWCVRYMGERDSELKHLLNLFDPLVRERES